MLSRLSFNGGIFLAFSIIVSRIYSDRPKHISRVPLPELSICFLQALWHVNGDRTANALKCRHHFNRLSMFHSYSYEWTAASLLGCHSKVGNFFGFSCLAEIYVDGGQKDVILVRKEPVAWILLPLQKFYISLLNTFPAVLFLPPELAIVTVFEITNYIPSHSVH